MIPEGWQCKCSCGEVLTERTPIIMHSYMCKCGHEHLVDAHDATDVVCEMAARIAFLESELRKHNPFFGVDL